MKRAYERVTLTRTDWEGPEPAAGDVLRTTTGRMYEILAVRGQRLDCRVLPTGSRLVRGTRIFDWHWNRRNKHGRRGGLHSKEET